MVRTRKKGLRFLALFLAAAMIAMLVPVISFASAITAEAVAVTVENGENKPRTNKIIVNFSGQVVFAEDNWKENIVITSGDAVRSLGDEAEAILNSASLKRLEITLGENSDVQVGDTINFTNAVIQYMEQTEAFEESVEIGGSFEPARVSFKAEDADAVITVDGYTELPSELGIGERQYTVEAPNRETAKGSFEITADDLGKDKEITIAALEKAGADYTALDAALATAEAINGADYSSESMAKLNQAIDAASSVDRSLKYDEQGTIDELLNALNEALGGLAKGRRVSLMAVATATDAAKNYAKADKIVIVFSEPIEAEAETILAALSIADSVVSAKWVNEAKTVLEITLDEKHELKNGTEIVYEENAEIKTEDGSVVKGCSVSVVGDLEGAAEYVTATGMAATIVKDDATPKPSAGDKIVIVFNAPVKDNPETIEITTNDGTSLTASAIENTYNTVYEIVLNDETAATVSAETTLTFGDIENVSLFGSFGSADAPKALRAFAIDNNGNALTTNDNIIIVFDRPTNGIEITSAALAGVIVTGVPGASFGNNSTAEWMDNNTKLVITIGDTAVIADGISIYIKNLGIMDPYSVSEAANTSVKVDGSFGYTIFPRITKAVAFTQNELDYIRVFFNTEVIEKGTVDATVSGFKTGAGAVSRLINEGGLSYYEIVMEKDEHSLFESGKHTISLSGIADKETGTLMLSDTPVLIKGAFVAPITPELISVTAISADGSGIAKSGDKIAVVFNTDVIIGTIDVFEGSLGTETVINYANGSKNVIEITLGGSGIDIVPGTTKLSFSEFKDYDTESITMDTVMKTVSGSFGYNIDPALLSLTAVSLDGSGVAKSGDSVVAVFNTLVENVSATVLGEGQSQNGYVWTFTLSEDKSVKTGDTVNISFTSVATGEAKQVNAQIGGSFGYSIDPQIVSATAVSRDGSGVAKNGDKIIVVFNTPVTIESWNIGTLGAQIGTVEKSDEEGYVYTISIETAIEIEIGREIGFTVTAVKTGESKSITAPIGGSFGYSVEPKLLSATAISLDGSGVAKSGDKIIMVFNAAVEDVSVNIAGQLTKSENGYVWTLTLAENGSVEVGVTKLEVKGTNAATGAQFTISGADVGGSFGYSETISVKSVVLSESGGEEIISVIFSGATNKAIDLSSLETNNKHIGRQGVVAVWENDFVLKITLGTDATTTNKDTLNLSGLGIKSAATGADVANIDALGIAGSLIPVVKTVEASAKKIVITFSTRTNGVADISKFRALLGIGAKTEWSDNNKVLTITLGENYSITNNGYIVLNGMGIKDGFSGTYALVGQYKVGGAIDYDKASVLSVTAQSNDKSVVTAQSGDNIVIRFNTATNISDSELSTNLGSEGVDAIVTAVGYENNEQAFGTGYSGMWTAFDTFVITLGGTTVSADEEGGAEVVEGIDPQITVGDTLIISGVSFASGEGLMDEEEEVLGGSFNGREFVVKDGLITREKENSGDYMVQAKVENTLLSQIVPTIVCVAYNNNSVAAIERITVDVETSVTPIFEFSEDNKITRVEIYVFSDAFSSVTSAPEVLAETLEIDN